ncbi:cupin domain-containing protein [Roseibium sp. MMSF_3544]|uniref:cupin domain-containing protein n=1 Tax=unclassified Roseibium TaxID=2629323 RepID=UPI00273E97D2|nr:cupin domain-containing protein [Roseibium sp. MMSF_3544]
MSQLPHRLTLSRITADETGPVNLSPLPRAFWTERGAVNINGKNLTAEHGLHTSGPVTIDFVGGDDTILICFEVAPADRALHGTPLLNETVSFDPAHSLLRLDTVTFPPGAQAYRHTHAGSGIRYLFKGTLDIHTDQGVSPMTPGSAWFEPLNTPVTAYAAKDRVSAFVRCMVIPKDYEGTSTFKLCDPEDAEKPRLQVTHRIFDAPFV